MSMKVKCSGCQMEETLSGECIEELACIIKKYRMGSDGYTYLLDGFRGNCLNDNVHSFIFDDSFKKEIEDIVGRYNASGTECEKLEREILVSIKELTDLEAKVKELKVKISSNKDRISLVKTNMDMNLDEIEVVTGYRNLEIWK